MKKLLIVPFILLSFLLTSCETTLQPARGFEDEIFVVADSVEYETLRETLEDVFEQIIYTPQPEKLFSIKRISVNELNRYKTRKNLIIIAPLNSGSYTSQYINSVLDSAAKEKINNGDVFYINRNDLWAKNQIVMLISSPDLSVLQFNMLKENQNLLYYFQKASDKRLSESLYNPRYEQADIEGKLLKDYGWIIYVQADFKVARNKPDENFVWLRRGVNTDMERWIFVHWIENASPEYLNEDSVRALRNRLTEKYYRTSDEKANVEIARDYFSINEVNFNNRFALFTQGLWRMSDKSMGGPFVSYTFYDENTKRLYMLDGSIYAPKYYKRNLIQQVDVILQSFYTDADLKDEVRNRLLKAAKD